MMKRLIIFFALMGLCAGAETLEDGFISPPAGNRPQVWWWFTSYQEASAASITRDLEAMKAVGISGFHLYGGWNDPTPEWRTKVRWALQEASRLGLDAVLCIGDAGSDSNHTKPEHAQKELTFSDAQVKGPGRVEVVLPAKGAPKTPRNADGSPQYYRDLAVFAVPDTKEAVPLAAVIDISKCLDPVSGKIAWEAPAGSWRILRVGYAPNLYGWSGCYIDHLSREALDEHWRITMAPLLSELTTQERGALKGVLEDSYEAGTMTWTPTFPEEFLKRRGYDVLPWLAARCGVMLEGAAQTAKFQRDFAVTISDLLADNHYAHLREVAHQHGLLALVEAAGPNQHQADVLKSAGRADVSMGEVWMPSGHRPELTQRFMVRDAATAAHAYGIREVLAETFTTIGTYWTESPATMKPTADRAFCDGLNRICYHGMMLSPSLTAKPGMVRKEGTHYNPQTTWWPQSGAFNLYLARCSWMLQQGRFVADALLYHGDNLDLFAGSKTPAEGLGKGYDYDYCTTEILQQATARDGRVVLPSGMRYRVLMLSARNPQASRMRPGKLPPPDALPPVNHPLTLGALQKLAELVRQGATIAGNRPAGPSSLVDEEGPFQTLVDELWGSPSAADNHPVRQVGQGRVITSLAATGQVLAADGLVPDLSWGDAGADEAIDWIHRQGDGVDIYFVANLSDRAVQVDGAFRIVGQAPEIWDPVTGEYRLAADYRPAAKQTVVPLSFEPHESKFVVFRHPAENHSPVGRGVRNSTAFKLMQEIPTPWTVSFDPRWGGPESVIFDGLEDWTKRPEEDIRHYSGTAVYRNVLEIDAAQLSPGRRMFLDLGGVQAVAEVSLNGRFLGTLWTAPWRIEATQAIKPGENHLEIRVTNLWPNRLIGDAARPREKRFTETNLNPYSPDAPLLPSGLLGPVRLIAVESPQ